MTVDEIFQVTIAVIASLLIGANVALFVEFGRSIAPWFRFKLAAVMVLLIYVIISMIIADPGPLRLSVGIVACLVDIAAFHAVYRALIRSKHKDGTLLVYRRRDVKHD